MPLKNGYMPLPKEFWSRYMKFTMFGKSKIKREEGKSTNLQTKDNL
jgi:hypothetical protein